MKSMPILALSLLLLLGGCGSVPVDLDGTLDRIRGEGRFRVGLVASPAPLAPDRAQALLERLSRATGARAAVEPGAGEALLHRLEGGELDLVLGEFVRPSPWEKKVTITDPVAGRGPIVLAAAARNGENAWVALLFREAKAVAAAG